MITLVMMIVISLLVVGFAEISRNEQRSSLDNQLSVQAYYAAESGINDAREAIHTQISAGQTPQSKTTCGNQGSYTFNSAVDAAHDTSYTCLLINPTPASLSYNVGYSSTVVPITSGGAAFGKLTLAWDLPTGATGGSAAGCYTNTTSLDQLPVATGGGQWNCDYPVIRVDMLDANGPLTRANWNTDTATMFFVPFNSNSTANSTTLAARGSLIPAQCGATNCTANITGLGGTKYYMKITTLYRTDSLLTISSSGNTFSGAEATIDATGKAQDVLRRVVAAVDLTNANMVNIPSAAIVSKDSICKRFGVTNGSFAIYDNMSAGGNGSPLCTPQNSSTPPPSPTPPPPTSCDQGNMPAPPSGYTKTILDDKFSGTQINTSTWNTYAGDGFGRWDDNGRLPSPYSEIGNGGEFNAEYGDPSEVTVNNGLTLGADRSNKFSNLGYSYSAGYVTSYNKFTFDHGYYQICTKIPDSRTGGWFTVWFLGGSNEMDLNESGFTSCGNPVNGCIHSNMNNNDVEKWYQSNIDLSAGYHALGMDYRPGKSVEIYFDGKPIISFTKDVPTGSYYNLITSTMATPKTSDWHTIISGATPSSSAFKVSEVQVWQ